MSAWIRPRDSADGLCPQKLHLCLLSAGYAGYVPAKMPPAKPSATQAALWSIQNPETLELIAKLLKNVAVNPSEEKYRRIRLTNPKIKALVADEEGGLQAMLSLGWEQDPEDADALVVTKGRHFSMAEVSCHVLERQNYLHSFGSHLCCILDQVSGRQTLSILEGKHRSGYDCASLSVMVVAGQGHQRGMRSKPTNMAKAVVIRLQAQAHHIMILG